ncbi:MAG: deoxyribonuclease V [Spirochaetales bacterium]|nr:deoxyribonuclease V [Spirochaetales bacterium]
MKALKLHKWQINFKHAVDIQNELAGYINKQDCIHNINTVCGVDVGFKQNTAYAAAVVLSFPKLKILERSFVISQVLMPYIPGLLSFREIPALIPALEKIKITPDLLMADGQGLAHPRRMGLASHLGLIFDLPAVGCAKSRLIGQASVPENRKGDYTLLYEGNEVVGAVLRTKENTKPLFISIGHKISLTTAIKVVLDCCTRYRLPEPTRRAHLATQEKYK